MLAEQESEPVDEFPLGKTGGLIEASSLKYSSDPCLLCFRWVKPAASLKQPHTGGMVNPERSGFPLGKTGGLIEAGWAVVGRAPGRRVSAG